MTYKIIDSNSKKEFSTHTTQKGAIENLENIKTTLKYLPVFVNGVLVDPIIVEI